MGIGQSATKDRIEITYFTAMMRRISAKILPMFRICG
jgi:hypothetical protein